MENNIDTSSYTRTLNELAAAFGLKTTQLPYHVKKHLDELGVHVYKKPGATTPYLFDDEGYKIMYKILKESYSPKNESESSGNVAPEDPLNKAAIEILIRDYEKRTEEFEQRFLEQEQYFKQMQEERENHYKELLMSKDDLIEEKERHIASLKSSMIVIHQTIESKSDSIIEPKKKRTVFSRLFMKKKEG